MEKEEEEEEEEKNVYLGKNSIEKLKSDVQWYKGRKSKLKINIYPF